MSNTAATWVGKFKKKLKNLFLEHTEEGKTHVEQGRVGMGEVHVEEKCNAVSWAKRSLLVVHKANREHLLESGGRPVCRTVAHQSLDDLILSLLKFFESFDRMGTIFQRSLFGLGHDECGVTFFFYCLYIFFFWFYLV